MEAMELSIRVSSGGRVVASHPVSAGVCYEDALFRSVVQGHVPNDGRMPSFELCACWSPDGPPVASAVTLRHPELPAYAYERDAFAPQARHLIRRLVASGELAGDATVEWELVAQPRPSTLAEVQRAPFPFEAGDLADVAPGTLAFEIDAELLDALQRRVLAAGATECAAMLLGRLLHDAERGAALVRLTDEIPLEVGAGGASLAHFSFDPASFVRARREAALRTDAVVPAGWVHSHPGGCAHCLENPSCPAETVFFSAADVEVHTAAFPAPYMVGLVAGKLRHLPARRPGFRLFGWRGAEVVPLSFTVTGPAAEAFRAEVVPVAQPEVCP